MIKFLKEMIERGSSPKLNCDFNRNKEKARNYRFNQQGYQAFSLKRKDRNNKKAKKE